MIALINTADTFGQFPTACRDLFPAGQDGQNMGTDVVDQTAKLLFRVGGCYDQKFRIIGKNGAGKTTLLRQIAAVLLNRIDLKVAYMPQNYQDSLTLQKTPVEFLASGGTRDEITRARNFLGSVRFTRDEMSHTAGELSGGQKAKLFFLKMVLDQNDVLILDEPTRNFSPLSNPVIRQILKEYGGAIISVTHDRKYLDEVCNQVYELKPEGLLRLR